jgi:hypothetical protein
LDEKDEDENEDEEEEEEKEDYNDDFSDQMSSSRKSQQSVIERKPDREVRAPDTFNLQQNTRKQPTMNEQATSNNLLSKGILQIMFFCY